VNGCSEHCTGICSFYKGLRNFLIPEPIVIFLKAIRFPVGRYLIANVGKTHNILANKLPVTGIGYSGRCRLVVGY
jgi:hypothetical protein